jgi:hypothetical protein
MAFQHRIGMRVAYGPDRNAPVGTRSRRASIAEQDDGIDGVVVETQHLLGNIARQRPSDRSRVEASGKGGLSVSRDHERAHRPTMAAQLRHGCRRRSGQQNDAGERRQWKFSDWVFHSRRSSRPFVSPSRPPVSAPSPHAGFVAI